MPDEKEVRKRVEDLKAQRKLEEHFRPFFPFFRAIRDQEPVLADSIIDPSGARREAWRRVYGRDPSPSEIILGCVPRDTKQSSTAIEHKPSPIHHSSISTTPDEEEVIPINQNVTVGLSKKKRVDDYIEWLFQKTDVRWNRTELCHYYGYKDDTEFGRWQRDDPRCSNKAKATFDAMLSTYLIIKKS